MFFLNPDIPTCDNLGWDPHFDANPDPVLDQLQQGNSDPDRHQNVIDPRYCSGVVNFSSTKYDMEQNSVEMLTNSFLSPTAVLA